MYYNYPLESQDPWHTMKRILRTDFYQYIYFQYFLLRNESMEENYANI
jgi:hypothetical protein